MKFTVEVEGFWLEEEDLSKGLEAAIRRDVIQQISKSIETKVEQHLAIAIQKEIEKNMYKKMNLFIEEFIKTEKLKSLRNSSNMVSVTEYIREKFEHDSGWSSASENIKNIATKFGQEMKNRYDMLFATQLVVKMNETGMLREDVAKKLLE
jgi:hypothetical protein